MAGCVLYNHGIPNIASIASATTQKSRVCTTPTAKVICTAHAKPRLARVSPSTSQTLSLHIFSMGSWAATATFMLRKLWLAPLLIKVKPWEMGPLLLPNQRSSAKNFCSSDAPWVLPTMIYPIKACGKWPITWVAAPPCFPVAAEWVLPLVVPQSGALHTGWLILPVVVLTSSACHALVSFTRAWNDLDACSSSKAAVHFVRLGCAQCECYWLVLLHGMQPLCHCLALHQDPLVEAHCVQLRHGLLPHALLRVLRMKICLDQQPTLVHAQMGATHGGSNPGPLRGSIVHME